ncbi:MAG TPA: hypothetical protein VNI77_04435 [Nitrososphaera sp.]|nr:hypothetical protein [Nitrososphaera sp.]
MNYGKFCEDILHLNESIRLVLLFTKEGDIVGVESRIGDSLLMPPQQMPELIMKSLIALNVLKTFDESLGKLMYAYAEFDKAKGVAVVLGGYIQDAVLRDCILLVSFAIESDHYKILEEQLFPFLKQAR